MPCVSFAGEVLPIELMAAIDGSCTPSYEQAGGHAAYAVFYPSAVCKRASFYLALLLTSGPLRSSAGNSNAEPTWASFAPQICNWIALKCLANQVWSVYRDVQTFL